MINVFVSFFAHHFFVQILAVRGLHWEDPARVNELKEVLAKLDKTYLLDFLSLFGIQVSEKTKIFLPSN